MEKHCAELGCATNSVQDDETACGELQYRLLQLLNLLNELKSRISVIQSTQPTSYRCAKTLELVKEEWVNIAALHENSKNLVGSRKSDSTT